MRGFHSYEASANKQSAVTVMMCTNVCKHKHTPLPLHWVMYCKSTQLYLLARQPKCTENTDLSAFFIGLLVIFSY